jgi:hypothetical protein
MLTCQPVGHLSNRDLSRFRDRKGLAHATTGDCLMKPKLFSIFATACLAITAGAFVAPPSSAEVVVRGPEGKPLQEIREAPAFLKPDVSIVTAQPAPSDVNPSFLGPVLLMKSAKIDLEKGTATLPLYQGQLASGETVWFILTDATDENLANLHGLAYSPKLAYGFTGRNQRTAEIQMDGTWTFNQGKVDFSPDAAVTPGDAPNFFPPKDFAFGAMGDDGYTPIARITNAGKDVIFNAPMVAFNASADELNRFCDGNADNNVLHDKVISICPERGEVTLALTTGFTFGKPILYLSTEANHPLIATLEGATFAPAMEDLPFAGEDATPGEAAERIYVFANGPTGLDNPHRQGVNSALSDGRGPLNVLGGIPTINLDYSPLWRLFPAKWTDEAIQKGYRTRMTDAIHIENLAAQGYIESLEGGELRPLGFIVNCPVVYRVN